MLRFAEYIGGGDNYLLGRVIAIPERCELVLVKGRTVCKREIQARPRPGTSWTSWGIIRFRFRL